MSLGPCRGKADQELPARDSDCRKNPSDLTPSLDMCSERGGID